MGYFTVYELMLWLCEIMKKYFLQFNHLKNQRDTVYLQMSIQLSSIPFEELISIKYSTCHYFASWSHTRQGLFQIALYFRSKYLNKRFKIMLLNQVSPQGPYTEPIFSRTISRFWTKQGNYLVDYNVHNTMYL